MAKIQNISEIHPTLGFTEFDIIEKKSEEVVRLDFFRSAMSCRIVFLENTEKWQ